MWNLDEQLENLGMLGGRQRSGRNPIRMPFYEPTPQESLETSNAKFHGIPTMYGKVMQRRFGSPPAIAGALGKQVQAGMSPIMRGIQDRGLIANYPDSPALEMLRRQYGLE